MADNTQAQSILFRAPFDVRRIIFAYSCPSTVHVYTKDDRVVVSACVSPDAIHDQSDGEERKADLPPPGRRWDCEDDYLYAQRLMSTWGPHWRCEEAARKQQRDLEHSTMLSMLRVCKLMQSEIADLMVRDTVFNFTGMHTSLQVLTSRTNHEVFGCTFQDIRKLDVTLRLPMDVFRAVEQNADKACDDDLSLVALDKSSDAGNTAADLWPGLCDMLAQLPKLTKMRLWLDHDECQYWAKVDEVAFIAPLITSFEHNNAEVTLHLPFVNPRLEDPERHFQGDKVAPHVSIDRRRRQRNFGCVTMLERLRVDDYLDFPCLDDDTPYFEDMEADARIARERRMWKDGENMQYWKDGMVYGNYGEPGGIGAYEMWKQKIEKREKELGISLKWPTIL